MNGPRKDKRFCVSGKHRWIPENLDSRGSCYPCQKERARLYYRKTRGIMLNAPDLHGIPPLERYKFRRPDESIPEGMPFGPYGPTDDGDIRALFLAMVRMAIFDAVTARVGPIPTINSINPIEQSTRDEALDFLTDPEYRIQWDDTEISLSDMLNYCDIDPEAFKRRLLVLGIS